MTMTDEQQRVLELEQALLAALSASQQFGISAADVRLSAMAGLLQGGDWAWISEPYISGAIREIESASGVLKNLPRVPPAPFSLPRYRRRP